MYLHELSNIVHMKVKLINKHEMHEFYSLTLFDIRKMDSLSILNGKVYINPQKYSSPRHKNA